MEKPPSQEIRESIGKTRGLTPNLTRSKPVINTKWTRNLNQKEHTYEKVKLPSKKKVPKISKYDADADTSSLEAQSAPTTTDPLKKELLQIAEQMRDLYELQKRSNNMFQDIVSNIGDQKGIQSQIDGSDQETILASNKGYARTPEPKRGPSQLTMNTQRLNEVPISDLKVISRKQSNPGMINPVLRDYLKAREEALWKEKLREREQKWNQRGNQHNLSHKSSKNSFDAFANEPGSPYFLGQKSRTSSKLLSQLKAKLPKIKVSMQQEQQDQYGLIDTVQREIMAQKALSRINSSHYLSKETTPLRAQRRNDSLDSQNVSKISYADTASQQIYSKPLKKRAGGGTPKFSESSLDNQDQNVNFNIDQNLVQEARKDQVLTKEEQIKLALIQYQQYAFQHNFVHGVGGDQHSQDSKFYNGVISTFQLPITKLHRLHPIFSQMSKEGAKQIIQRCCEIMFLRRYQILYNEGDYQSHIYLPLYGTLRLWNKERGIICSNLCMGMSVGEEALNDPMYVARSENCFAEQDAAVLCIERDNWVLNRERMMYETLQRRSPKRSGQDQVTKDINLLDEIFRFNYYNKKRQKAKVEKVNGPSQLPYLKTTPKRIRNTRGPLMDPQISLIKRQLNKTYEM